MAKGFGTLNRSNTLESPRFVDTLRIIRPNQNELTPFYINRRAHEWRMLAPDIQTKVELHNFQSIINLIIN